MKRIMQSLSLALLLLLLAGGPHAQEAATPKRWLVTDYVLKPGMQMQHEALGRRFREAAETLEWETPWFASSTIASDTPRFSVAIPIDSMTMFAEPESLIARAEGPEGLAEVLEIASETYESVTTRIAFERPDLGREGPEMDTPPVGYWSIRVRIRPGTQGTYEDYLRSIVQASSDSQYWNAFQGWAGGANVFVANIPIWDWSDMDGPPGPSVIQRLRSEFGDRRGNAIYESGTGVMEDLQIELFRWRWDQSWFAGNDG